MAESLNRDATTDDARSDPPHNTPDAASDVATLLRQLRMFSTLLSPSQPINGEEREQLSESLATIVRQLERLLLGAVLLPYVPLLWS